MNIDLHKGLLMLSIVFSLLMSGCSSLKVTDIKPQEVPRNAIKKRLNLTVGVETIDVVNSDYNEASNFEQGLADALRTEGFDKALAHSSKNDDLVIRGKVSGHFRNGKAKNFFTWWPGAIIFAHSWRGTQYTYDAQADVEVFDAHTKENLGNYHVESSYELTHKSGNPFPFLGALAVIPGVIKGSLSASPRSKYRYQLYEPAYQNLWEKVAVRIVDDQSKKETLLKSRQQVKCGQRLNEEPKIGLLWSDFNSCQTRKYRLLGQDTTESAIVSVYLSIDRLKRVHVAEDGRILRWFKLKEQ